MIFIYRFSCLTLWSTSSFSTRCWSEPLFLLWCSGFNNLSYLTVLSDFCALNPDCFCPTVLQVQWFRFEDSGLCQRSVCSLGCDQHSSSSSSSSRCRQQREQTLQEQRERSPSVRWAASPVRIWPGHLNVTAARIRIKWSIFKNPT